MTLDLKSYRRDCLLGALGALLMLIGDLCLSVIPAYTGDSGLFAREYYLSGAYEPWRLPLLTATGLTGMALGFFTVRACRDQIKPEYRRTRLEVIAGRFDNVTVFVETMNPMVVKSFKEKSIEGSNAKFTWGVKNGAALVKLLPGFRFIEEHSLTEGMAQFVPVYKLLVKLPAIRNISNKIVVIGKD